MDFNDITHIRDSKEHTNRKLITKKFSLNELKVYLRLRFTSYKEASISAGISECRVRQILIGYCLPKTSQLINQIANGWDIEPVKLALLFEESDNKLYSK